MSKNMNAVSTALIHYTSEHGGPPPDLATLDRTYPSDLLGLVGELQRDHDLIWLDRSPTADSSRIVLRARLHDGRTMFVYGDGRPALLPLITADPTDPAR